MSFSKLVHDPTFIFDGTNYVFWKICMLNVFRDIGPNIERMLDMGFPPPNDSQKLSLEGEENSYLNSLVSNAVVHVLSDVVLRSIIPYGNAQ